MSMQIYMPFDHPHWREYGLTLFGTRHGPNEHYVIFRDLLYAIVEEQQPMTVRQVFYRAVVKG